MTQIEELIPGSTFGAWHKKYGGEGWEGQAEGGGEGVDTENSQNAPFLAFAR